MTFWLGDAFDYSINFRAAIFEMATILEQTAPVVLDLPPCHPDEDFVEGSLMFRGAPLRVYYEFALGYLSVMSDSRAALDDVASRMLPKIRLG